MNTTTQRHDEHTLAMAKIEQQHPDHYAFKMALRDALLAAGDECCKEHGMPTISDGDLPTLFAGLDAVAERLFLRHHGITP